MMQCKEVTAWVHRRYKLTSQKFLDRLLHVRSIMKCDYVESIPGAKDLMRQLLWVESLAMKFPAESEEAAAAFMLCRHGQLVLLEGPDSSW